MATNEELLAADAVLGTVPEWPRGLPEEGPFVVPAKVWGQALQLAAFVRKQLTAPADADMEAELQSSIESAVQATSRYVALDDEADAVLKNQLRVRLLPLVNRGQDEDAEAETRLVNVVDSILRTIDFVGVQNIKRERVAGMIRPLLRRGRANDVEPRSVPLNIVATGEVIYRKETGDE